MLPSKTQAISAFNPEEEPPVPNAPLYWWTTAFLVSTFVGLTLAMLLFTPEVASAAAERLHDALFYVERV